MTEHRPPLPPFNEEAAWKKVLGAEAAWNTRDPDRVTGAYSLDSEWRNRDTFVRGRAEIRQFLAEKWERELDYALRKDLWAFHENRMAVRFQYECRDRSGQWWRSYGKRELGVRRPRLDASKGGVESTTCASRRTTDEYSDRAKTTTPVGSLFA